MVEISDSINIIKNNDSYGGKTNLGKQSTSDRITSRNDGNITLYEGSANDLNLLSAKKINMQDPQIIYSQIKTNMP